MELWAVMGWPLSNIDWPKTLEDRQVMELLGNMIATPTAGLPFAGILASIVVDSASDFRQ